MIPGVPSEGRTYIAESALFLLGFFLFAYVPHDNALNALLSTCGLMLAALVLVRNIRTVGDGLELFDLRGRSRYFCGCLAAGLLIGAVFAVTCRNFHRLQVIPSRLTPFALVAPLIGATEELLFRGYLQKRLRRFGAVIAIGLAALCHTGYKYIFFVSRDQIFEINYVSLIIWTYIVGLLFGTVKEYSQSVLPPLCGHALFDILVYGDRLAAPWWIWS